MFLLDQAGWCGEFDRTRNENGLRIPNAERLKALQTLEQSIVNLRKCKFSMNSERRFEISLCETLPGIRVETLNRIEKARVTADTATIAKIDRALKHAER